MFELVIRADPAPGKLEGLDRFITEHLGGCMRAGAKGVCVYEDALVGYPEREIRVQFEDLPTLLNALNSEEWRRDKATLLKYATNVSSQIVTSRLCL